MFKYSKLKVLTFFERSMFGNAWKQLVVGSELYKKSRNFQPNLLSSGFENSHILPKCDNWKSRLRDENVTEKQSH